MNTHVAYICFIFIFQLVCVLALNELEYMPISAVMSQAYQHIAHLTYLHVKTGKVANL